MVKFMHRKKDGRPTARVPDRGSADGGDPKRVELHTPRPAKPEMVQCPVCHREFKKGDQILCPRHLVPLV